MKRKFFLFSVVLAALVMSLGCGTTVIAQGVQRPKLVVGIVVDQMRWDYLYRYNTLYCDGGFKRLMAEGYNCENTMINYLPSVTAIGHTSVFTGSVPAIHGMAGNNFYVDGRYTYCCEDTTVRGVGSDTKAGRMSPRNMLATTIGDELRVGTDFKSRVFGVALKDRAAILSAGHSANAAYWVDYSTGGFITSTYYMNKLPNWVVDFNKKIGKHPKAEIQYTSLGNRMTEEMAKAVVENEKLGQTGQTDMLTMSFSCTDMVGHKFSTHSPETQAVYIDVDRRLADFFSFLDKKIGKGNYLVFLTADHGASNNILFNQKHGIPAEGFFVEKALKGVNEYLKTKFNTTRNLVIGIEEYRVYIDHKAVDATSLCLDNVKKAVIEWFKKDINVAYAVDFERVAEATIPAPIKEKITNGYFRRRSGDVQLILNPACYDVYGDKIDGGTTHGQWNPYDAHIPFLLMGWGIKPGAMQAKTTINDIAATVCGLIHIQMPNGCIGNSVFK